MDKIKKFLRKLTFQEQLEIDLVIEMIVSDKVDDLDVKRLQGYWDIFRVRKGNFRVIFKKTSEGNRILEVTRRNDNTYNKY